MLSWNKADFRIWFCKWNSVRDKKLFFLRSEVLRLKQTKWFWEGRSLLCCRKMNLWENKHLGWKFDVFFRTCARFDIFRKQKFQFFKREKYIWGFFLFFGDFWHFYHFRIFSAFFSIFWRSEGIFCFFQVFFPEIDIFF